MQHDMLINGWEGNQTQVCLNLESRILRIMRHSLPLNSWFVYCYTFVFFSAKMSVVCVHYVYFFFFASLTKEVKRHGDSNHRIINIVHLYCEASQLLLAQFNWWLGRWWCWFRHYYLLGSCKYVSFADDSC